MRLPARFRERITLIGVGAVGRHAALLLASAGAKDLQLVDRAVVGARQVSTQGYFADDIGRAKVHATADICQQINPQLNIGELHCRFQPSIKTGEIVFCCVSSSTERTKIRRSLVNCRFCGDAIVSGDSVRVRSFVGNVTSELSATAVEHNTKRRPATLPAATVAAAFLVRQFLQFVAGQQLNSEVEFDLLQGSSVQTTSGGSKRGDT